MNSNKIDQKIQSFLKDNPLVKGKSNEEILSIMVDFGIITPAELKKGSAFEKTDITASDKGLVLEKSSPAKQTDAKVELTREEAQDDAVENLGVSVLSAQTLFENQKNTQGDVSRVYDMYKELTKDDLSQGKLKQAITLEKLGYTYINQAKSNTLTKKEYYEHVKEDLLMMTPGIHSMSENSIKNLKQRIDSLTIEEVKLMQKQLQNLPSEDNKEYETQAKRYLNNFKSLTEDSPEFRRTGDVEIQGGQFAAEAKIKPPVNYSDADELIKFEEVFKYERGTTFSSEKIAEFETAKTALQLVQSTTAKVDKIHSNLDKALANPRGDWQASDYGKVEMGLKMSLRELFGDDEMLQQEGLAKLFGGKIPNNDIETSKLLLAKLDENYQKIMNGKSVEDFEQEYADTYTKAFGKKNSEQLAKAYIEDNESIGARITSGMQMGGMAAMIVGGAVCLIPGAQPLGAAVLSGGGKLAMTGMAAQTAVEAINESSKTGGMTDEAQERIIKEGLVNLVSFAVGAGAGIKGAQVGANLMAKGSGKFVALMAERGTDVAISMAGDMILMGDLNVEGNMIGQITATLTGLKTGKNIAKNHMNKGHLMDVPHSDLLSNPHISGKHGSSLKPKEVSFTGRKTFEAGEKHNKTETGNLKLKSDEIIHHDKVPEDVSVENIKPETERVNPNNEDYTSNLVEARTAGNKAFAADKGNPYSKSTPDGITREAIEASLKTTELRQRGFTDDRIKDMAEFVKDDPNKIAVLKKLIPLEHQQFGYVAIREFLQSNSDVPAEILDKFLTLDNATREVRGGDLSVYEIDGILRSLKNNDGSMIDNYKETADFAYKLLSRKSDEGAMSASTIQEVIYKYGIDEKAASDVFELMSVKGMGRNQISSKDAVQLYEYAKDKNISIKEIRDVLILTPEQLKNRGGNPLNAVDVKSILDYAPDKADIVKDLASLPTRTRLRQENISTVAAIVQQCGDDANKISDLKRLLMLERPLNEFSQEARHFDILFANMISRDAFEGKIETIEKLFMLKPKQREKWLALDYLTDNKTVKNSKVIFDLVSENYKNLSPEDIKLLTKPENIDNVTAILKANPKLTVEGIQAELKNINVKKLTPLVKDERLMKAANYIYWDYNNSKNHPDWKLLEDLQFKFENVNDKHVQEYLKNTFAEIDNISKVPVTSDSRLTVNVKLEEMSKVLDVYHTLAGHYNYIGIKDRLKKDLPTTREFIDLVKSENPDAAQEFSKYATQQYGRPEKLTFENISEEMGKDFMRDLGVERLKEFAKIKPDSPLATHFYEHYLLAFDSETSKRCADINKKYNTKIILSAFHDDYKVELDFVEAELKRWHDASDGKAVMPPVLDFSKAKEKWFGSLRYGNGVTPIGYSEMSTNKAISVSGMHVDMIEDVLRHEMTHSNTKLNVLIDSSKYDLSSIMPDREVEINGKKTYEPDFEKCKYREEFLKAGVPSSHIPYGYNDIYEFMSVASEGDMSKYSPEFKQMLVDFGMPEWELKMECVQKGNIKRAQLMSEISEKYPELKTYDELRIMQGVFEMNEMLPEHKKWKNDEIIQAHKKFMNAIAEGSNCEVIIFSSREYLADHLRPLLSHSGDTKILTEENSAFIKEKCQKLHEKGVDACDYLVKSLFDAGLGDEKSMSYRVKGEHSLFDKIKNYLFDNIDKDKCYFDAELEIRDLFAARTVVSSGEYAKHPDVVKFLQAGDKKGAQLRAAELQSQPTVDKLKALIDKQSKGESDIEITRISNYKGADGIPYLSEAQLADIKQFALDRGIQLDYVTRIEPDDPMFSKVDAKAHNNKAATKVRDSGYTALQLNFKNKADEQIFEWQFRGDKVTVFAEAEHVPYDLRTGKNITSAHPELEPLYAPIQEILSKKAMTEAQFNKYNEYLTAHYEHLRKLELGFESTEPRLEDYGNFDKRLHARSLEYLHDAAEKIKANTDTPDAEIIKEYTRLVNS